jgi:hypothetical protein
VEELSSSSNRRGQRSQEFEVACVVAQVEPQVAGLLDDPCGGRVRGDTQDRARRVACSTTAKEYSRVKVIVSAGKKSQARIPSAWVCRNWPQLDPDRCGTGSMPALRRIRLTVAAPTFRPRPG